VKPDPPHKRCPRCQQSRPASAFYKRRNGQLSSHCQECQRASSRESRERRRANPVELEQVRAVDRLRRRRYRALHPRDLGGGDAA
jgi:recombinational DNA repair protein (RecF pathway)